MHSLLDFEKEITHLLKARYSLLFLATCEEERAIASLCRVAHGRNTSLVRWSRTRGLVRVRIGAAGDVTEETLSTPHSTDPAAPLQWVEESQDRVIVVLQDFHPYLKEPSLVRKLRDLSQLLKTSHKNVVLLSPTAAIPPELTKEMTLLEMPLPTREEILALIDKIPGSDSMATDLRHGVAEAASGLTLGEIENVLAKSLVAQGTLSRALVHEEKRQIVKKSGVLEYIGSRTTCKVGGLGELKSWLNVRKMGFSEAARAAGLPLPKGLLLVGIPGCGKSLTATTIAHEWSMPLLRLDMGRVFSGIVGSSEANLRDALKTAEAVAPCVLWMDEIEKGLSGSQSSGKTDGGTSSRVFGTVLTWMQEKEAPVFVVATANDISALPVELLRKGRFDEIFFVDLPDARERLEILSAQLLHHGWTLTSEEQDTTASLTQGFSGAEIEQVLIEARFLAFSRGESLTALHMEEAARATVPLSATMPDRIAALRGWAENRARFATAKKKTSESVSRLTQTFNERTASL